MSDVSCFLFHFVFQQGSPVTPTLNLQTISASSSNSSSRESTLKRGAASPSEKEIQERADRPGAPPVSPDAGEEADEVPFAPLAEGKVLTKKGKQIDASSAGNVKLNPVEKAADLESEDDYGYTRNLSCMNNRWRQT
ncbi:hypothetical protein CDAR_118721 [Caerostris darwini]|uniref:Uncharacterized protein n=1 Tax=Caerostris darwini TaxID=1538125 RepID=A0AAV4VJW8_9ARAC|nr:hypothetical protein CDAR_118721 [Caerostris darwini]